MNVGIVKPNWKLYLGIPILIYTACYLITFTPTFKTHPQALSYGILADLIIVSPLIYFLIIRKSTISKSTIIRVFLVGIAIAGLILNTEKIEALSVLKK